MGSLKTYLLLIHALAFLAATAPAADVDGLVYKGCSNQTFPGNAPPPTIAAVSNSLTSQASSSKFFKTTSTASPSSASTSAIFGLFQCRGDLTGSACASCVGQAISMWSELCGPASLAARVQLTGCLALYEIAGFPQVAGTEMLYKTCGNGNTGEDFEIRRDTALAQLQAGLAGGGNGFSATSYQSVYTMAQCEGDLSATDCVNCVTQAVQRCQVECGGAPSGQVYLDMCYVSYSYYAHGIPHGGGGGLGGQQTGKTVAIVLGGAVGLGFLVICLLFARSLVKKNDDY